LKTVYRVKKQYNNTWLIIIALIRSGILICVFIIVSHCLLCTAVNCNCLTMESSGQYRHSKHVLEHLWKQRPETNKPWPDMNLVDNRIHYLLTAICHLEFCQDGFTIVLFDRGLQAMFHVRTDG